MSAPGGAPATPMAAGGVVFPDAPGIARRLGTSVDIFHREIKRDIMGEHRDELGQIGSPRTPDIGVNQDTGNVVFRNPQTGRTIETTTPLENYRRE